MKFRVKRYALYLSLMLLVFIWIVRGFSGHYEAVEYNSDMVDYIADSSYVYNLLYVAVLGIFIFYSCSIVNSKLIPRWLHLFVIISLLIGFLYFLEGILVHHDHFFPLARAALNPLFLLMVFMVFAVYNDSSFKNILTIALVVSIIFVILDVYVFFTDVQGLFVRGHTPLLQFRTGAYWCFIFYMSFKEEISKRDYLILFVGLMWCTVVAFIIVSRSWCIQGILSLLLLNMIVLRDKKVRGLAIVMLLVSLCFIIPHLYGNFLTTVSYVRFEDKMGADTRSMQYIEVFRQMPAHYFILGNGFHTSWMQDNVSYSYIDNQTIMFLYRYGILPTLTYYLFLLIPVCRIILFKRYRRYYKNIIVTILWVFAINGLSVFNTLNWDWANFLVIIASARLWSNTNTCHCKYEQYFIRN